MSPPMVELDPRARRAFSVPVGELPLGAVYVAGDGTLTRVRLDGGLDELVLEGGAARGIAADPTARRLP